MTKPRENRTSTTMAQLRVTDFFSARKRTAESQPSKRRKLNIVASDIETLPTIQVNTRPTRSSTRNKNAVDSGPENQAGSYEAESAPPQRKKPQFKTKTVSKRSRKAKTNEFKNQINISDAFAVSDFSKSDAEEGVNLHEEVTSAWDEHAGCPQTPSKRTKEIDSSDSDSSEITRKRTRRGEGKKELHILTPEKQNEALKEKPRSARKRLHLNRPVIESSDSNDSENEVRPLYQVEHRPSNE